MITHILSGVSLNVYGKILLRSCLLILLFFILTSFEAYPQEKKIFVDGKEAVLFKNGTWEYAKPVESKIKNGEPEKSKCEFTKNEVDEINGTSVKVMKREKLISYTPDEMNTIFTEEDYLTIDAYLSNYNGSIIMYLKVTILSNNALNTYGSIYKNNELIFKLTNGQSVSLYCGQSESGSISKDFDRTTYLTYYELSELSLHLFENSEIEKARLFWGKGYEDYYISNKDFFIRQIECVK